MILVIGASGNVGRHVVAGLSAEGTDVRAMARPLRLRVARRRRGRPRRSFGRGDAGCAARRRRHGVPPLASSDGDHPKSAVETIARHAHRVVYVSSLTVDDRLERQTHPMTEIHAEIERVIEGSGLGWTMLRAGRFATNCFAWASQIRAGDIVRLPNAASGRSPIDPRDVAAVGVRTLLDTGHVGQRYALTGPERLTEGAMAHIIGEVIGRAIRVEDVPAERARRELLDGGASPELAEAALAYWRALVSEPEPVTSKVREITGSSPRPFRRWVTDHADVFR